MKRTTALVLALSIIVLAACGSSSSKSAVEREFPDTGGAVRTTVSPATTAAAAAATTAAAGTNATAAAASDGSRAAPSQSATTTVVASPPGTFVDYGVNRTTRTSSDAVSKFALDVDTASYSVVRAMLNQGTLPPFGAVRTEEFVNSFQQGYDPDTEPGLRFAAANARFWPSSTVWSPRTPPMPKLVSVLVTDSLVTTSRPDESIE